jgi:hypothetical protein
MDDLLSHLNRTKKLFMVLVASSFIIAPLAIVLSILVFTPPLLAGVGQPQDVVFARKAAGDIKETPPPGEPSAVIVRIVPGEQEMQAVNITGLKEIDSGTFMVDRSQISIQYVPEGFENVRVFEGKPASPRFMYVGSAPAAAPFDVTWVIVTVIAASVAMAGVWLFIGAKEYRFFADWNRRYSNYKAMQEKVDKELGGDSTG